VAEPMDVILALLGAMILALGLASAWLEKSPFPPTLLALGFGIAVGPAGLDWVDPEALADRAALVEGATRLVLGISLMGVALRVPRAFPRRSWRGMLVLTGAGMLLMWGAGFLVAAAALGVPLLTAALIAAILAPTDPVAASPVVTGPLAERTLPGSLRHAISFDSGANDGLAYLFVFLPLLLLTRPVGEALPHWLTHTLLWEVGGATAAGALLGWGAARLLRAAEEREAIEGHWRLVYTVALALLGLGVGRLMGSDELLTVFAAGVAFTQVVSAEDRDEEEYGQEAVNRFFSYPVFALLGALIPWAGWRELGWSGVALAAGMLLLRRLPALLLLRPAIPELRRLPDALFAGWFGPMAVAALYYAALSERHVEEPVVWSAVTLVVCASVVLHGMTAAPFTQWYARRVGELGEEAGEERGEEAREAEEEDVESGEGRR
jgi:sodium/hydrogen antiporter